MSFVRKLMGREPDREDKSSATPLESETHSAQAGEMHTNGGAGPGEDVAPPATSHPPTGTRASGTAFATERDLTRSGGRASSHPAGLCVGYATDVGQMREHNEDSLVIFQGIQLGDDASDPFGLFVLADGMGGQEAGEVASSLAARLVSHHILDRIYLPYLLDRAPDTDRAPVTEVLIAAVKKANQQVHDQVPGGGTTITCALILGRRAFIAHVGDSRAYLLTGYDVQQVTHDHSYVGRLLELGELSPEEAAVHPQRHVLYRAVGQGSNLDVDTYHQPLPPRSRLLLCSDGLSGTVSEQEMGRIVAAAGSPQEACERLVKAASDAGGPDNITAVLVEMPAD
jgi:PPM family protein phosphatase